MATSIRLEFTKKDDAVRAEHFLEAVGAFFGLLRDVDARVSGDPKGTVRWRVTAIGKTNPYFVECQGESRLERQDWTPTISEKSIHGLDHLRRVADRTEPLDSDSVLRRVRVLGRLRSKVMDDVRVSANGKSAHVDPLTLEHTRELLEAKYSGKGSVVGRLETITVHKANEFRVWDEVSGRPVSCFFSPEMLERVKGALTHRVLVHGIVRRNHRGVATAVSVEGMEPYDEGEGPAIEEVSGLIDDLTEGKSLSDYMRDLRDD